MNLPCRMSPRSALPFGRAVANVDTLPDRFKFFFFQNNYNLYSYFYLFHNK